MKMDKIKRFIDCGIPIETCNLRCHYCYITQQRKFNNKIEKFKYTPEYIRKALSKERLGGVCLFNFCAGGETLLSDEVLPIVKQLLGEGHYVMIVTNGTLTKRFDEILTWEKNLLKRLFFKFSFHYLEMKRLNWIERFCSNVNKMKDAKVSFTVEITPSDELIPFIEEVKEVCISNFGTLCHVTVARDERKKGFDILSNYDFNEYKKIWNTFNSDLFEFKSQIFYKKRTEFCYAGDWSCFLFLGTGNLTQCLRGKVIDNIYEDINRPIHFEAIGKNCPFPHCYNGHAFLALGDIPELKTPTYANLRNRVCKDGTEWLQPEVKQFFSTKLCQSNKEYDWLKKIKINNSDKNIHSLLSKYKFYQELHKIKKKL